MGTGNEVKHFCAYASVAFAVLPPLRASLVRQTEYFDVLPTTGVFGECFLNILIDFLPLYRER